MRLASVAVLSLAGVVGHATIAMDHIRPSGATLGPTAGFGVMQIFPDFPDFSGTVIDDFVTDHILIDEVGVAFELSSSNVSLDMIKGWQVSIWDSVEAAGASGNGLNQGTVAQSFLAPPFYYTRLNGTSAVGPAYSAYFHVVLTGITPNKRYWIGMAPVLEFVSGGGQTFVLSNTDPAVLGAGTPNDSVGINPGNGFGLGTTIPVGSNAAYFVYTTPEPSSWLAFGGALAFLALKRRK